MNEMLSRAPARPPTQAADGLPRRRWTADELDRMLAAGILHEDERIELIGGEVVTMAPKGRRHELVRTELAFRWTKMCPTGLRVAVETPLRLNDDTEPQPDIIAYPANVVAPDVTSATVLLVVEIADSRLGYDLHTKAQIYAASAVPEYWVIDANTLSTHVHRDPTSEGYATRSQHPAGERLVPLLAPELALALADLGLG